MTAFLPTPALALASALLATAALATPAAAVTAPDTATVLRLQSAADSAWRVRVTTRRATFLVIAPRIDLAGVTVSKQDDPPALFSPRDVRPVEKRVTWAEIEQIETERSTFGRGAARGALIGAGISGALLLLYSGNDSEIGEAPLLILSVLGIGASAGIGALMGLGGGEPTPLYP